MKNLRFTIFLIIIAVLAGFIGGTLTNSVALPFLMQYQSSDNDTKDVSVIQPVKIQVVDEDSQIITAIERISPTVVSIVITKDLQIIKNNPELLNDPFGFSEDKSANTRTSTKQKIGGGTGFIFTENGLIVTNKHVVEDQDANYTVILNNGDEYPAEVVDKDIFNDIAIVRLLSNSEGKKPSNLPVVTFGDSKKIKVGQRVIVIGNALSELANTVTVGVISAKGRNIIASDVYGREESLTGLLQTDAAINLGNSGGPLVNLAGEVVGISTAIASDTNRIGFAIPINDITVIIDSIKKTGRIIQPALGVRYIQLDEKIAKDYQVAGITEGALLIGLTPNRPAEEVGLQENDIIIEINGETVTKENTLRDIVSRQNVGDPIKITYLRSGKQVQVEVSLQEAGNN